MSSVRSTYLRVHRQGFVPIFVADRFDAVQLAEACVEANVSVIEITCRRDNVCDDIRRVRRAFPSLSILVGSIVDEGVMLDHLRRKRPDFPTPAELVDLGIEGLVSAAPLTLGTIERYSDSHILMPGVETVREAFDAVQAGAHAAKFFTTSVMGGPQRIATVTSAALHRLLPVFVTGGVTLDRVQDFVDSGTAMLGSGWDVILGSEYRANQEKFDSRQVTQAVRMFLEQVDESRRDTDWPRPTLDDQAYLDALPHYHPF